MGEQPPFSETHNAWVQKRKGAGVYAEDKAMGDNWRTDEPEVGQVAWVKFAPSHKPLEHTCVQLNGATGAMKGWRCNWSGSICGLERGEWKPITTPEERRLRAEVEKLKDDLHHTCQAVDCTEQACKELRVEVERLRDKLSQIQDYLVSEGLFESWMGYETKAGGADER